MVLIERVAPRRAVAVVGACRYEAQFDRQLRRWRVQTDQGEQCSSSAKLHSIGKLFGTPRAQVEGRRPVVEPVALVVTDPAVLRQVRRMRDAMRTFTFDQFWVDHQNRHGGATGHSHRVGGDPIFHTIGQVAGATSTRAETVEAMEAVLAQRYPRLPPRLATTLPDAIARVAAALVADRKVVRPGDGGIVRITGPWLPPNWDETP